MPKYSIELLEKYLANTISPAELTELQSQFSSPEELEKEAKLHQAITEGIQSAGNRGVVAGIMPDIEKEVQAEGFFEKTDKKIREETDEEETAPAKATVVRPLLPFWVKVAAAVVILLIPFALWLLSSTPIDKAIAKSYQSEQDKVANVSQRLQEQIDLGIVGFVGMPLEQLESLKQGVEAYKNGKSARARGLLQNINKTYPRHEVAAYYLALSLMEEEKYEEAHRLLAITAYFKKYRPNAQYFNALCLLKMGRKDKALPLLVKVAAGNSEYAGKAKEVIALQ